MHTDQIHPSATQHMPHRQRRPALPRHRHPQAGPDYLAMRPEPNPVRGPGQPRRHHQLADPQPIQAPGQLSEVILHPPDRVVGHPGRRQVPRLEHRTQPQHAAHAGRQHTPARRLPDNQRPRASRRDPGTGRRRPGSRTPARDLERRRSRRVPPDTNPAGSHAARHTARLVNSEHTEEDRVVPARQHWHVTLCGRPWSQLARQYPPYARTTARCRSRRLRAELIRARAVAAGGS